MNDYIPVIAVFTIGFIGYLGKAGVDSILARRRKAKEVVKLPFPGVRLGLAVGRDAMKEIFAKDKAKRELASKHSCNICGVFTTAKLCPKCRPIQEEFLEKRVVHPTQEEPIRPPSWLKTPKTDFYNIHFFKPAERFLEKRVVHPTQEEPIRPPSWLKTPKTDFYNIHFFKPAERHDIIRIMDTPGKPLFTAARQHYVSPANNKVYQCGMTRSEEGNCWEGKCPICDLYEHEVKKFHSSQRDAKKYKPTERFYYNINQGGVARIWSVSRKVHGEIQKAIMNDDIASSEKGKDIEVWTQRNNQFPSVKDVKLRFFVSKSNWHSTPNHTSLAIPWDLEAYNKHCEKDLLKAVAEISKSVWLQ